jgi:hypothetical protein
MSDTHTNSVPSNDTRRLSDRLEHVLGLIAKLRSDAATLIYLDFFTRCNRVICRLIGLPRNRGRLK